MQLLLRKITAPVSSSISRYIVPVTTGTDGISWEGHAEEAITMYSRAANPKCRMSTLWALMHEHVRGSASLCGNKSYF